MSTAAAPAFWERRRQQLRAVMRRVFSPRHAATHPPPAVDAACAVCPTVWIPRPPCEVEVVG